MEVVIYNDLDINEDDHYPFAVIEKVGPGLYNFDREEIWFQWTDGEYQEIEKPAKIKNIIAFSMG